MSFISFKNKVSATFSQSLFNLRRLNPISLRSTPRRSKKKKIASKSERTFRIFFFKQRESFKFLSELRQPQNDEPIPPFVCFLLKFFPFYFIVFRDSLWVSPIFFQLENFPTLVLFPCRKSGIPSRAAFRFEFYVSEMEEVRAGAMLFYKIVFEGQDFPEFFLRDSLNKNFLSHSQLENSLVRIPENLRRVRCDFFHVRTPLDFNRSPTLEMKFISESRY